jgi:hypothetical protein
MGVLDTLSRTSNAPLSVKPNGAFLLHLSEETLLGAGHFKSEIGIRQLAILVYNSLAVRLLAEELKIFLGGCP